MSLRMRDVNRIDQIESRGFEQFEVDDFEFLISTIRGHEEECVNAENDREQLTREIDELQEQVRELS